MPASAIDEYGTSGIGTVVGVPRNLLQASAGFIAARDLLEIFTQTLDLQLQMFPLLPKKIQQAAHAGRQSLLCILQNLRHLPTQAGRPFSEGFSAVRAGAAQEAANKAFCRATPVTGP
jgi:hypothetical protein